MSGRDQYWNGYSWRDAPTTPISLETIEHATLSGLNLVCRCDDTEYADDGELLSVRCPVHDSDPIKTIEQEALALLPGVQYDVEDHGRGLPDE